MKYRQSTIPVGKSYVQGPIDPDIAPLVELCKTKGLNPSASCAGTGPALSSQRESHDLWRDQPYIAFNPIGTTCNITDFFRGIEKYQLTLFGDQVLLSIEVMTIRNQVSENNDVAEDLCRGGWNCVSGLNLHMFYSRFGSVDLTALFPAMNEAGIPGLAEWLIKLRRIWLERATLAIASMPDVKNDHQRLH